MTDDDIPQTQQPVSHAITVTTCRPWVWIFVIVLSTMTGGMTGLYTGSYLTAQQERQHVQAVRQAYEKRLADQQTEHAQEITRMGQNEVLLSGAIQALSARLTSLGQKVDEHTAVAEKSAETANKALATAKISSAKTEVLEAKVAKVAPTPASEAKPAPLSPAWWHGSAKH